MSQEVSVIVPAYRHERYVGAALESVLSQTLGDLELIVIDDDSPDGTWDAIRGFRDPRIQAVRHEQNQGAVRTINEGLRLARGRYLSILNSDDYYHPRRLEVCLEAARAGAEFVATDVELVEGAGEVMRGKGHGWIEWFEGLRDAYRWSSDPLVAVLSGNLAMSTSNMFFAAEVVRRIGYFYEYRYAHDYEFLLRYLADPLARFRFLDGEKLLFYRLHEANTVSESDVAVAQEVFGLLTRWLADFAPVADRGRMAALARQLLRVEGEIEAAQRLDASRWRAEAGRWEAEAGTLRGRLAEVEGELARSREQAGRAEAAAAILGGEADSWRVEAERLRESHSFRLGRLLLGPLGLARRRLTRP